MKIFLAPYKGDRYHLSEFCSSGLLRNSQETFNFTHSSLRSVIEHTFGVWKARWKILQHMPNFKFDKQVTIVATLMALHNFIRRETIADLEFESYEGKEDYIPDNEESSTNINVDENEASEIRVVRENIARELMLDKLNLVIFVLLFYKEKWYFNL